MISWYKYWKLYKTKGIEIQFELLTDISSEWFRFVLETRTKQDHGGWRFELTFLKLFMFCVHFYDNRHWDYDNNRWKIYDDYGIIDNSTMPLNEKIHNEEFYL